jgi:hypothetical protein
VLACAKGGHGGVSGHAAESRLCLGGESSRRVCLGAPPVPAGAGHDVVEAACMSGEGLG